MSWLNGSRRGSVRNRDESQTQELARLRKREHALEAKLDNLRSLLRMTASLNATLNYDRVLELVLNLGAAVLKDTKGDDSGLVSALLLFDDDMLQVVSARGLTRADQRVRLAAKEGVIAAALSAGKPQGTRNPSGEVDPHRNSRDRLRRPVMQIARQFLPGLLVDLSDMLFFLFQI